LAIGCLFKTFVALL